MKPVDANAVVETDNGRFRLRDVNPALPVVRKAGMWVDFFRIANDGTPVFNDYDLTASRFRYVTMNVWERAHLYELKSRNPDLVALAYQNAIYDRALKDAGSDFQADCASAVSREQAEDSLNGTVDWYVRGASNAFVLNPFNGSDRLLDLGLPHVQAAWTSNVVTRAFAGTTAWDGVFADNFDGNVDDTLVTPYANDDEWIRGALRPAAMQMSHMLSRHGLMFVANYGSGGEVHWMSDTLPFLTGYTDEFFTRYANGGWNGYWYDSIVLAEQAIRQGTKAFLQTPGTSNTDEDSARSGLAAALLATHEKDPGRLAYSFSGQDYTNEKWFDCFDYDIGEPIAPRQWTGTEYHSALVRYFRRGVVVLNPATNPGAPYSDASARSAVTVDLEGGPYTDPDHFRVRSVTLQPGEGRVLPLDA